MNEIFDPGHGQKVPIHCWADRVDRLSLMRLKNLAQWDRLAGPIAVMPDVHPAGELCVGTVLVTRDCVLPTAIGEDLGCGMCSRYYEFDAHSLQRADLARVVDEVMRCVPTGMRTHGEPQTLSNELAATELSTRSLEHLKNGMGRRHMATLGGGNHFIELQKDAIGRLWVTVHSGSRGIGAAIARHHAQAAAMKPFGDPMSSLELGLTQARLFLADMNWALLFAAENRKRILDKVEFVLHRELGLAPAGREYFDVAHNLVRIERHAGSDIVVHRKGAMTAEKGMPGIIPGSMGTASYVVEGLGNPASYSSASHGAGRKLSRTEAHKQISVESFRRQMRKVVYPPGARIESALIEEAPAVYKDIKEVLDLQRDLVQSVQRLEPIAVVKGGS